LIKESWKKRIMVAIIKLWKPWSPNQYIRRISERSWKCIFPPLPQNNVYEIN